MNRMKYVINLFFVVLFIACSEDKVSKMEDDIRAAQLNQKEIDLQKKEEELTRQAQVQDALPEVENLIVVEDFSEVDDLSHFDNIDSNLQVVSDSEALSILRQMYAIELTGDFNKLKDVYCNEISQYYDKSNFTIEQIMESSYSYRKKWVADYTEVLNFERIRDNSFSYEIDYRVQQLETGNYYHYNIKGIVKYKYEDGMYKIHSIKDLNTQKIK